MREMDLSFQWDIAVSDKSAPPRIVSGGGGNEIALPDP